MCGIQYQTTRGKGDGYAKPRMEMIMYTLEVTSFGIGLMDHRIDSISERNMLSIHRVVNQVRLNMMNVLSSTVET